MDGEISMNGFAIRMSDGGENSNRFAPDFLGMSLSIRQLFRSFLHEWRMIQRTAACLLRDSPGAIRGKILRILQQLCEPGRGFEEARIQHCHLDLLWTYRESRQA